MATNLIPRDFGFWNYSVLAAYHVIIFGVAVYYLKRQKTTADYFKAGKRIPGWAAGISAFATVVSSITFLGSPERAFTGNWAYILGQYTHLVMLPFIFIFYIPFFRKMNLTSAYEYLEARFDRKNRLFGSTYFILYHVGRISIITYLLALAVVPFLAIDIYIIVAIVGILGVLYTMIGGVEGVVWADVIQGVLMSISIVGILISLSRLINGGVGAVVTVIAAEDKFFPASLMTWSWTDGVYPVLILGFLYKSVLLYAVSQDVIQRYLVTENLKETKKTIIMVAFLNATIPALFFASGSMLYVFYLQNPGRLPSNFSTSGILPLFSVNHLPQGLAGFVIAAIFAASQSSISSSLNSISACYTIDFYKTFGRQKNQRDCLRCARIAIFTAGILGVSGSYFLVITKQRQIWNTFIALLGLLGGPLTGQFFLGIFTRVANGNGVFVGIVASIAVVFPIFLFTKVNLFFYGPISVLTVVTVGSIASLFFKKVEPKVIQNYTIWRSRDENLPSIKGVSSAGSHTRVIPDDLEQSMHMGTINS